eukprot:1192586-Prorocentrum_minimum.AAC.4
MDDYANTCSIRVLLVNIDTASELLVSTAHSLLCILLCLSTLAQVGISCVSPSYRIYWRWSARTRWTIVDATRTLLHSRAVTWYHIIYIMRWSRAHRSGKRFSSAQQVLQIWICRLLRGKSRHAEFHRDRHCCTTSSSSCCIFFSAVMMPGEYPSCVSCKSRNDTADATTTTTHVQLMRRFVLTTSGCAKCRAFHTGA